MAGKSNTFNALPDGEEAVVFVAEIFRIQKPLRYQILLLKSSASKKVAVKLVSFAIPFIYAKPASGEEVVYFLYNKYKSHTAKASLLTSVLVLNGKKFIILYFGK